MKDKDAFHFSKLSSGKLRAKAEELTFIEIAASEHAGIDNAETESSERRHRD